MSIPRLDPSAARGRAPANLRVGPYELQFRLGEGGMGVVHLARHADGRRVALKVLRPHIISDQEARHRLAREVNALSLVSSPRVAEIVDADPWGPVPYVATRYVPGPCLDDYVESEGPISGDDLLWLAECLVDAVEAVHNVGVVHRDVKPSNIVMEGRSPVLIDFGLARVADDPKLTHVGWLLGTPSYLAPELIMGEDASVASDLHAIAATLTFAATGRPPFGSGSSMEVMDRVRAGESDLAGLELGWHLLLADALSPDPRQRPTLAEFRRRLAFVDRPGHAASYHDVDWGSPLEPDRAWAPDVTAPLVASYGQTPEPEPMATVPTARPTAGPADNSGPGRASQTRRLSDLTDRTLPLGGGSTPADPPARLAPSGFAGFAVIAGLSAVAGGAIAMLPWMAGFALVMLVWLLRSGSLAASAVGQRRQGRGVRWYDGPLLLLSTPWHLLTSVGGTIILVLWSCGVALAAALLGYAIGAAVPTALSGIGFAFALGLAYGPGGDRVRGPVLRASKALMAHPLAVMMALVLLLGAGAALTAVAISNGVDWAPFAGAPWSGLRLPGPLSGLF